MAKFEKGKSGNPGGRPRVLVDVQALAREHTTAALNTLVAIMNSSKVTAPARVAAANAVLDRAYGKPTQFVHDPGKDGLSKPPHEMTDAELEEAARQVRERLEPTGISLQRDAAPPTRSSKPH
jgi:hypothetical protein